MSFLNDDEDLLEGSAEGSGGDAETYGSTDWSLVTELPKDIISDTRRSCNDAYISFYSIKCEFFDGPNSTFYQCIVVAVLLIALISLIIGIKRTRYKQGQQSEDYY